MGWRRESRVAGNTVWSHMYVITHSSEVISTNYFSLFTNTTDIAYKSWTQCHIATCSSELGVGGNCPQTSALPQTSYETCLTNTKHQHIGSKMSERSVTVKLHQHLFLARPHCRSSWGSLDHKSTGKGTPRWLGGVVVTGFPEARNAILGPIFKVNCRTTAGHFCRFHKAQPLKTQKMCVILCSHILVSQADHDL